MVANGIASRSTKCIATSKFMWTVVWLNYVLHNVHCIIHVYVLWTTFKVSLHMHWKRKITKYAFHMNSYLYKSSFHGHLSLIDPDWGVKIVRNWNRKKCAKDIIANCKKCANARRPRITGSSNKNYPLPTWPSLWRNSDVYCIFVTFPCGILGQVWYMIVSFPDLCPLSYFNQIK